MEDSKKHFRLGLFVFTTVIILAGVLFLLGGRTLFEPTFTFETYFNESVAGLDVGASVKFRGVPMGQVTEILLSREVYERDTSFDKARNYIVVRAKVKMSKDQIERLGRDANDLIKSGLRTQTQLAGITGQQYLSLDIFNPQEYPQLPFDWKPKYLYVPSAPSATAAIIAGVQSFMSSLDKVDIQPLGQNLNTLVVSLNKKITEVPVAELSTEASAVLKGARATIDRLDSLLSKGDIDVMLGNFAAASGRFDGLLADPGLKQTVDNVAEFSARLRKFASSGDIDRTVRSIDAAAARLSVMVGDNQFDMRVIVQDLRVTADNLRMLSETIKRNPAGVLLGGPPDKLQLPGKTP